VLINSAVNTREHPREQLSVKGVFLTTMHATIIVMSTQTQKCTDLLQVNTHVSAIIIIVHAHDGVPTVIKNMLVPGIALFCV
jgi:hypothetical protein